MDSDQTLSKSVKLRKTFRINCSFFGIVNYEISPISTEYTNLNLTKLLHLGVLLTLLLIIGNQIWPKKTGSLNLLVRRCLTALIELSLEPFQFKHQISAHSDILIGVGVHVLFHRTPIELRRT